MSNKEQNKSGWTDERVEKLIELWTEGLSASKIAAILGGVSRNAVIGKAHRLRKQGRLAARASSGASSSKESAPARRAPRRPRPEKPVVAGATALKTRKQAEAPPQAQQKPAMEVVDGTRGRITDIMELNRKTCRWPIGDPGEEGFAYCGDHAQEGSPYCLHHSRIAYQTASSSGARRARG